MSQLRIERTDYTNADFGDLVVLLDQDLRVRDGDEHVFYASFNKVDAQARVVVAYLEAVAVGCGAFKKLSESEVEIKRMYVRPECRGRGIAGKVLAELESWARELGYTGSVLETGKKQPEAIGLYQKSGYTVIPNFGQYQGIFNSICMRKALGSRD